MKSRTTAYHPAGNGACERVNQTLKRGSQKIVDEKNLEIWDSVLPMAVFAYNSTIHSATGFTTFYLMFGEEARFQEDFWSEGPKKIKLLDPMPLYII